MKDKPQNCVELLYDNREEPQFHCCLVNTVSASKDLYHISTSSNDPEFIRVLELTGVNFVCSILKGVKKSEHSTARRWLHANAYGYKKKAFRRRGFRTSSSSCGFSERQYANDCFEERFKKSRVCSRERTISILSIEIEQIG